MKLAVARTSAAIAVFATAGISGLIWGAAPAFAGPSPCGTGTLVSGNLCQQTFTATTATNFTPPAQTTKLEALLVGGGGGGAVQSSAAPSTNGYALAGGGGHVKIVDFTASAGSTAPLVVTAGAGGVGGTATGAAGATTTVTGGPSASASGGGGAQQTSDTAGSSGRTPAQAFRTLGLRQRTTAAERELGRPEARQRSAGGLASPSRRRSAATHYSGPTRHVMAVAARHCGARMSEPPDAAGTLRAATQLRSAIRRSTRTRAAAAPQALPSVLAVPVRAVLLSSDGSRATSSRSPRARMGQPRPPRSSRWELRRRLPQPRRLPALCSADGTPMRR